ncbi:IS66 family insertion sequence element accessory protein TnpA [Yersinia wautersii]|uniref:Transposase n=1 Tax=Yersinia wautersii TaxID=1341643 RepID=A0ABP1ZE72_9GAMM|nr:hypothetical protein [Yersinia wautersii]CRG51164.1 Uncharacterised protein [Yersinia wautersii]
MTIRYSRSERQHHIDAWQQSGMSKQYYCQLHDLNPATFNYWLKHPTVAVPATFIPAQRVVPENNDANTVTLNLPKGCSVRCQLVQLRAVMQALCLC